MTEILVPTEKRGLFELAIYGDIIGSPFEALHFFIKNYGFKAGRITMEEMRVAQRCLKTSDLQTALQRMSSAVPKLQEGLKKMEGKKFTFESDHWTERPLPFTDDTVMTIATADALLQHKSRPDFRKAYRTWGRQYPDAGYGKLFKEWLLKDTDAPIHSLGNGGAMRVAPVAFAYNLVDTIQMHARESSVVSHNNPEGIRGTLAVSGSIAMARAYNHTAFGKKQIKEYVEKNLFYNLSRPYKEAMENMRFHSEAPQSVPEAIIAFLASEDPLDAVYKAIAMGGDQDTMACIAGSIATPYYGYIPEKVYTHVREQLPQKMIDILDRFQERFGISYPILRAEYAGWE